MRRKYLGLAIAAIATLGPAQAFGGDREIAQSIIQRLKTARDDGHLKNFNLDMKVNDGVVLFKGSVDSAAQQALVLEAASDLDGIARIVNELTIVTAAEPVASPIVKAAPKATLVKPKSTSVARAESTEAFDFSNALVTAPSPQTAPQAAVAEKKTAAKTTVDGPITAAQTIASTQSNAPGLVQPTAAFEQPVTQEKVAPAANGSSDQHTTQLIVAALGKAKQIGHLKSFGVDVQAIDGIVELTGQASSDQQRQLIAQIAGGAPGVRGVRNLIDVAPTATAYPAQTVAHRQNAMPTAMPMAAAAQPMPQRQQAQMASYGAGYGGQMINGEQVVPGSVVNHGPVGGQMGGQMMGGQMSGAPMMGSPVPMAPAAPAGAPRYDSPNLPNYAWPGYAAYPNYAALSYPQQYSPSAFPYIGPFYPYPQVPLGWRKVSLEWDDGWWFLDFTDR